MCIQPYTETTLRALQLRRRSHHYGLRSRVSQGSPQARRAQVPKRLRSWTAGVPDKYMQCSKLYINVYNIQLNNVITPLKLTIVYSCMS